MGTPHRGLWRLWVLPALLMAALSLVAQPVGAAPVHYAPPTSQVRATVRAVPGGYMIRWYSATQVAGFNVFDGSARLNRHLVTSRTHWYHFRAVHPVGRLRLVGVPGASVQSSALAASPVVAGPCPGVGCSGQMLALLNHDRALAGEPPLVFSARLSNGAGACPGSYGHSVHMAAVGGISHDQFPTDVCFAFGTAGENVGMASMGNELSDLQAIDAQMMAEPHTPGCSDNHACNILSRNFHHVGIGIYVANNTTWLTEDFTN